MPCLPVKNIWWLIIVCGCARDYAINPFDVQLGCRFPTPQERSFLVNFLTLLVTPVGSEKAYDGVADMSGLVVDELYKALC